MYCATAGAWRSLHDNGPSVRRFSGWCSSHSSYPFTMTGRQGSRRLSFLLQRIQVLNVKLRQDFPLELAQQLNVLKEASQEAEEDLVTDYAFAGERLFIKPHGAEKQWRWILHSPSLRLDVGLGKHTQIVAKARLSAAYLWATEIGDALTQVYAFLTAMLGSEPYLQVSEAHLCVDIADWELAVGDAQPS
jgi:hypothetical protein